MHRLTSLASLVVLSCFVLLAVQNLGAVKIRFITWSSEMSLAVVILAAYLFGGITLRSVMRLFKKERAGRKEAELKRDAKKVDEAKQRQA